MTNNENRETKTITRYLDASWVAFTRSLFAMKMMQEREMSI